MTKIFLVVGVTIFTVPIFAKDLGVVGKTYAIQEEDFLTFIQKRMAHMQKNGEWAKLQDQFKERVARNADRPHPVDHLTRATTPKYWNYDPSIMVPYDLKDTEGRIFAKAGTSVNPLTIINLHKALVFFDGDDAKQVAWAENINTKLNGKIKLILVRGSVIEQEKRFLTPIYFDQEGRLTKRFSIQHVPAIVQQEGFHLKISEIAL